MRNAIIVADDSSIVQKIIGESLKDEFTVLKAEKGTDVISLLMNNYNMNIVGVLLDLNMPESDGFMVLNYFKDNNLFKRYPVVIISGDDTKETIEKAFTYNIVDMLNKPFSIERVKDMVKKMMEFKG